MDINQTVTTYTTIFEKLRKQLRWKVSSNQLLMAIASTYMTGEKAYDSDLFLSLADEIKKKAKPLSIWRSQTRFSIAAIMDTHFNDAPEKIEQLFGLYDQLVAAKFHRGAYSCIAAAILLIRGKNGEIDTEDAIARARKIYQEMKSEHIFLTSSEDYPLSIALACENQENILQNAEQHYQQLNHNGFRRGNGLQFLSHILALGSPYTNQPLVSNATDVFDAFKDMDIKPKPSYYPLIGMLALLPDARKNVQAVKQLYIVLRAQKHFKWQKDMNIMLAAGLVVKGQLEDGSIVDTSLFTIMESILQAQQAAMTATAISSAAAAQNSGGSN